LLSGSGDWNHGKVNPILHPPSSILHPPSSSSSPTSAAPPPPPHFSSTLHPPPRHSSPLLSIIFSTLLSLRVWGLGFRSGLGLPSLNLNRTPNTVNLQVHAASLGRYQSRRPLPPENGVRLQKGGDTRLPPRLLWSFGGSTVQSLPIGNVLEELKLVRVYSVLPRLITCR